MTTEIHGYAKRGEKHPLYNVWVSMKSRCNCKTAAGYENYGGRGIKVVEIWESDFMNFYNWAISNGYKSGLFLDRIDNNSHYSPDNCKFSTREDNNNNKRNNIVFEHDGITATLAQYAKRLNIPYKRVYMRFYKGWSLEECLRTRHHQKRTDPLYTINNITATIAEHAKRVGLSKDLIHNRIKLGWEDKYLLLPKQKER